MALARWKEGKPPVSVGGLAFSGCGVSFEPWYQLYNGSPILYAMLTRTGAYLLYFEFPGEVFVARPQEAWLQSPLVYVGSAMGRAGFSRVSRHLKRAASRGTSHWHIDQILQQVAPRRIYLVPSRERLECHLAQLLARRFPPALEGFGSSDCTCRSHLFSVPWFELEQILHGAGHAFVRLCNTGDLTRPGELTLTVE